MKSGFGSGVGAVVLLAAAAWAASEPSAPEAALVVVTCRSFTSAGAGNGFVIGDGTLVVTCDHIVTERSKLGTHTMERFVAVYSPYLGEACDGRILAHDAALDLAVLEVPWAGHPALSLADANEVLMARRARVISLYTAVRRLGKWSVEGPPRETFQVGVEERPVAFVGVRQAQPRLVALDGIGLLGHGWSGAPMLLPGTSVAIGCFASVQKVPARPDGVREEGNGAAVSQVPTLLAEGWRRRIASYQPARRDSPADAREICELALRVNGEVQEQRYDAALESARTLVQRRPDSAFAHATLAYASERVGQTEAAREHYEQALKLDPNNLHHQLLTAQFLGTHGEPNAAREILEPLWRSGRAHDLVGIALVNLLGERKEWPRVLEILGEATRSHPQNAYLWQQVAACRLQLQGPSAALEPLTRAVEVFPEQGPLRGGLAQLLEKTGALDEAERHFRALLAVEPQNPVVYYWLAEFLHKHRPQAGEEAVKIAEKALSLPPGGHLPREKIEELIKSVRDAMSSTAPER
jgi:tetratricopeptide (TPR) repeat protein